MIVPGDLFGVLPLWVPVFIIGAIGAGASAYGIYTRFIAPVLLGKHEDPRFDRPLQRLLGMVLVVFGQRRVLMSVSWRWRDLAGIGHFIIFWGFISKLVGYSLFLVLDPIDPSNSAFVLSPTGLKFFFWWLDILTVLVLGAVLWAAARRWIGRPKRLEGLQGYEPGVILMATASLMLLHQLTQISIVAAAEANPAAVAYLGGAITPEIAASTPIAGNIGAALGSAGFSASAAKTLHGLFYWAHFLLTVSFGVYIPFSKHFHIIASPLNAFFRKLTPRGALRPIPNMEEAEVWGAKHPHEFSWKELVDGYACAVCGRCTFNCPANISGKPLSPMDLIEGVKHNLLEVAPAVAKAATQEEREQASGELPLLGRHFTEEWVWDCVTCGACVQECPVMVDHIDSIVDLRRHLVMTESNMPPTAQQTLQSLETRGHPWRGTQASRTDWTDGLPVKSLGGDAEDGEGVDVLFWVGCTAALEERSQATARAMARVLERAGVSYAILGNAEGCTGDPARRIGHEYLFEIMARRNVEVLDQHKPMKIVTTCPHCFNTLKHEYPDFGGTYEVEHYATFVRRLMDEGKLKLGKPIAAKVTYHDSCYLGRHNGIYDEPRDIVAAIPGIELQEVPLRNRERGFCCGAGGGHMFVEETSGRRINHVRTDQILETAPDKIGVSCPFCLQMLTEGVQNAGKAGEVEVVDLIELVGEAME